MSLISVNSFYDGALDPYWFFPDTHRMYTPSGSKVVFGIESAYPFSCAIHEKQLGFGKYADATKAPLRITIRRWVEQHIGRDVIFERLNKGYRRWFKSNNSYDSHMSEIEHGYVVFHFETEADLMLFRLAYSEIISEIQDTDPDDYHTEENGFCNTPYG